MPSPSGPLLRTWPSPPRLLAHSPSNSSRRRYWRSGPLNCGIPPTVFTVAPITFYKWKWAEFIILGLVLTQTVAPGCFVFMNVCHYHLVCKTFCCSVESWPLIEITFYRYQWIVKVIFYNNIILTPQYILTLGAVNSSPVTVTYTRSRLKIVSSMVTTRRKTLIHLLIDYAAIISLPTSFTVAWTRYTRTMAGTRWIDTVRCKNWFLNDLCYFTWTCLFLTRYCLISSSYYAKVKLWMNDMRSSRQNT